VSIVVIDYGMGNLRSVSKALEHVAGGKQVIVTADPAVVAAAERVVFPGQGAMPDCMRELMRAACRRCAGRGAEQAVSRYLHRPANALRAQRRGRCAGLGVFAGDVRRFPTKNVSPPTASA
jgi:glutamine amidotransferase